MSEYWWEKQPPAARTVEALRKVFEMARCIPGSQEAKERDYWAAWLDKMERLWLGAGQPTCNDKPPPEPCEPYPGTQQAEVRLPIRRKCGLCGVPGHRATTCALNPKNLDVEIKVT